MMGLLALHNHTNKAPKPRNIKKRVKKNLELENVSQENPKGIEENLEEEGEEEEFTGSSRKGKLNEELPIDQTIEIPFKKKKTTKISIAHKVSISTKTKATKHITRHGKAK
jgi:hypothetical protein